MRGTESSQGAPVRNSNAVKYCVVLFQTKKTPQKRSPFPGGEGGIRTLEAREDLTP